ncbi:hypothetical protein HDK90DRAFT_486654 [Phyllosticta capitalensis]|uniref:Uncharacterized protein n=1 Tax=Phyllosticta capitalensis TaxID=121624 RepID=A0ABR1YLR0_9PEZI
MVLVLTSTLKFRVATLKLTKTWQVNAEAVRCPSVRAVRRAGQAAGQAISLSADRHDFLSIQTSIPQPKHLRCTIPGIPAPFSRLVNLISPHFGPRCRPQFRFFTPLSAPPAACSNEPASRTPSPASPSPHQFHASRPVILLDPVYVHTVLSVHQRHLRQRPCRARQRIQRIVARAGPSSFDRCADLRPLASASSCCYNLFRQVRTRRDVECSSA